MWQQTIDSQGWRSQAPGTRTRGNRALMGRLADHLDLYRRCLRAGREIGHLSRLSDARLAALGLSRETLAREVLARHGML